MGDWTRFCDRLPTDIETNAWSKFPDAGVCIVLGFNGVVAVDIDTDQHEIVEAILDALPCESPVQKRGKKGANLLLPSGPDCRVAAVQRRQRTRPRPFVQGQADRRSANDPSRYRQAI